MGHKIMVIPVPHSLLLQLTKCMALETALEKEEMILQCISQCTTIGTPQSGKSSLKRCLLKQTGQPNNIYKSTGVAEKPVASAVILQMAVSGLNLSGKMEHSF